MMDESGANVIHLSDQNELPENYCDSPQSINRYMCTEHRTQLGCRDD